MNKITDCSIMGAVRGVSDALSERRGGADVVVVVLARALGVAGHAVRRPLAQHGARARAHARRRARGRRRGRRRRMVRAQLAGDVRLARLQARLRAWAACGAPPQTCCRMAEAAACDTLAMQSVCLTAAVS